MCTCHFFNIVAKLAPKTLSIRLIGLLKAHQTREQQEKQELELIIQQFQRQVQLTDAKIRGLEVERQKLQLAASQAATSNQNYLGGGANARSSATNEYALAPTAAR